MKFKKERSSTNYELTDGDVDSSEEHTSRTMHTGEFSALVGLEVEDKTHTPLLPTAVGIPNH